MKHDFFAATALYRNTAPARPDAPARIVLKLAREHHFLGLPLLWFGERLCRHEVSILKRLSGLDRTPRLLSTYGRTGFIYEYIEGSSLEDEKDLPPRFFDQLFDVLRQVHRRNVVYLDMNKPDNVLVGPDARPYLIDFQISLHVGDCPLLPKSLTEHLQQMLQFADIYHLFKQKRRRSPHLLWPHEKALSRELSPWIRAHRWIATPLRRLRRLALKALYDNGILLPEKHDRPPRKDPSRFAQ
jgi:serine/threonine protein kinase